MGVEGAIVVELGRSEGVRGKCRRNRINSCFLEVAKRGKRGRVGRVNWDERGRVGRVRGLKWEGSNLSGREEAFRVHGGRAIPSLLVRGESIHAHTPRVKGKHSCRAVAFRTLWKITKCSGMMC